MRVSTRLAIVVALVSGLVGLTTPTATAAYYNTYSDVASTPDASGATAAQGFAAGSTYLYSIKTRSSNNDDRSVIYRVNKSTGARVVMKNASNGSSYNTWLGHANDMTIVDIDGKHHFFVVTMRSSGAQLVKLRYDGTTYRKVGSYAVRLSGATKAVSGISRVSVTSSRIEFFFKSGRTVYRGGIPLRANSGTVNLSTAFSLKVTGALVNGKTVSDLGTFSNQGFFYDAAKKVIYYPLTKANRSIVLVYRNVWASTTGSLTSAKDLSFRITSSAYRKFEIEGVGTSGGRLYFNTNRATSSAAKDGVHVFKGYVVR
jgi:hypothetical protein